MNKTFLWPDGLTTSDQFAGGGGSMSGGRLAGWELVSALNHNQRAIETIQANFPTTQVYQCEIEEFDPDDAPNTLAAWFSPDCRKFSNAAGEKRKGQKILHDLWHTGEIDDPVHRMRMTMHEVVRWTAAKKKAGHPYMFILVENVTQILLWPYYHIWLAEMRALDYDVQILFLNSQFFGVGQSRNRWYAVFSHKKARKPDLDFHPKGMCLYCEKEVATYQDWEYKQRAKVVMETRKKKEKTCGIYGVQYAYCCPFCKGEVKPYTTPASSFIDWSEPIVRIGDRYLYPRLKDELSPKTLERIERGLIQYCQGSTEEPFLIETCRSYNEPGHAIRSVNLPAYTQTTAQSVALCIPPAFLISYYSNGRPFSLQEAIGALTSRDRYALVQLPATTPPGKLPAINDCAVRTLSDRECASAMGFAPNYIFCGTQRDRVALAGRAVVVPVAQWMYERCKAAA